MNKRLGEILIEKGYLSEHQVQLALEIQNDDSKEGMWKYIGQILVDMGIVSQDQVEEGLEVLKQYKEEIEENNKTE